MYVKDINDVKAQLNNLQSQGTISAWALPYENLLTRLSAAIFFISVDEPVDESLEAVRAVLGSFPHYGVRPNAEKRLSDLPFRITFNEEELIKIMAPATEATS